MQQDKTQTRQDLCRYLLAASSLAEVEMAENAFDQWLVEHPEDNHVSSPVWQAIGVVSRTKELLLLDLAEGIDSAQEQAKIHEEVAKLMNS